MHPEKIIQAINKEKNITPTRIMLTDHYAVSNKELSSRIEAKQIPEYKVVAIFIRHDGWTLATDEKHLKSAFKTWEHDWIGVLRKGFSKVIRINTDGKYWKNQPSKK